VKGLKELGFAQSKADKCVFDRGTMTFMVYVDDGILIDPDKEKIESALLDLHSKFEVQDEGDLSDYLGVKAQKHTDGSIEFTQPHLIDSILEDLKLMENGGNNGPKMTEVVFKPLFEIENQSKIKTFITHYL
jgi:Reverse transcriptase (RNA-dependent DNA polymerase)